MLMESGRIVLQAKARDPLRHPVARISGAAARDVQPIQNGRAGGGIGKAVQAAANPLPPEVQKATSVFPAQS